MWRSFFAWLGFVAAPRETGMRGAHGHALHGVQAHGHTHGTVDPSIATTDRGIWAIKWSFVVLAITSLLQLAVVIASGSVALLADTIHNVGDALTAVPLWIAFRLARRRASERFTYGYGRVEDFAEWVAVLRIRVGREINSAALIADGYHARTDGLTSLAVVLGAGGVWLGFPLADPVVGLLITIAIFGIVWQSSKAVLTRMLDGVEPSVLDEIRHAATHVPGIARVLDVRARWLGHRLTAELDAAVDGNLQVKEADRLVARLEHELVDHIPEVVAVRVRVRSNDIEGLATKSEAAHPHAPRPVAIRGKLATGIIEIAESAMGERLRFVVESDPESLQAEAKIARAGGEIEVLRLTASPGESRVFWSAVAPQEPHEFEAELILQSGGELEKIPFRMFEPGHAH